MKIINSIQIVLAVFIVISCSSVKTAPLTKDENRGTRQYITLMDYMRGVPGVQIHNENYLTIRGLQSAEAGQEPLYIIDGAQVGNSFVAAKDYVDPNDIDKVIVLKDFASTSAYGLRGSNGVIVIKTKKEGN